MGDLELKHSVMEHIKNIITYNFYFLKLIIIFHRYELPIIFSTVWIISLSKSFMCHFYSPGRPNLVLFKSKLTILPNYLTVLYMPENPVNLVHDFFFFLFSWFETSLKKQKAIVFPSLLYTSHCHCSLLFFHWNLVIK